MYNFDVIIIGAGAAGMMCAIQAAKRGKSVLLLDHAKKIGRKILMSGGGNCNFTNTDISHTKYLSNNKHFCKSALGQYSQWDFIKLVEDYNIKYYEKKLGQLFCVDKAKVIVNMLLAECSRFGVTIKSNTRVNQIRKLDDNCYKVILEDVELIGKSLVIATGGLSIPTMGASAFGYEVAKSFGLRIFPTKPALVPFESNEIQQKTHEALSGVSFNSIVTHNRITFHENCLFTHRGLSGPAALQISSYWDEYKPIEVNMLPGKNIANVLYSSRKQMVKKQVKNYLYNYLPKRVCDIFLNQDIVNKSCCDISNEDISNISKSIHSWNYTPGDTEGYRTAEVTLGGVDCDQLSSKTMESNDHKGLFFIGEVVDIAGWLGGYNFQWAWSSGYVAGCNV